MVIQLVCNALRNGHRRGDRLPVALVCCLLLSLVETASACNVPVFRYALERWRPDAYEVIVFYDKDLPKEQREWVDRLQLDAYDHPELGNLSALTVDIQSLDEKWLVDLWASQPSNSQLPHAVVVTPSRRRQGAIVWSGPLANLHLPTLRTSPARQELTRRLLTGDAVVWLVVANRETAGLKESQTLLDEQLQKLQNEIELPPGIGDPGSELLSKIPLAIKFSQLLVDASDPAEQAFVQMLVAQRPTAKELKQPLIIPVFGRGRALDTLAEDELNAELIQDACHFLCAACSCRVKEQNPGFDLLLAADWQQAGDATQLAAVEDRSAAPQLIAIPPGSLQSMNHAATSATDTHATTGRSPEWWLVVILSSAVCAALFLLPQAARSVP